VKPSVLALGAVGADSNIDSNVIAHPAAQAILHNLKLQGQNAMTRAGPELTRKRSLAQDGEEWVRGSP
jgi:hypothetical protein